MTLEPLVIEFRGTMITHVHQCYKDILELLAQSVERLWGDIVYTQNNNRTQKLQQRIQNTNLSLYTRGQEARKLMRQLASNGFWEKVLCYVKAELGRLVKKGDERKLLEN